MRAGKIDKLGCEQFSKAGVEVFGSVDRSKQFR